MIASTGIRQKNCLEKIAHNSEDVKEDQNQTMGVPTWEVWTDESVGVGTTQDQEDND